MLTENRAAAKMAVLTTVSSLGEHCRAVKSRPNGNGSRSQVRLAGPMGGGGHDPRKLDEYVCMYLMWRVTTHVVVVGCPNRHRRREPDDDYRSRGSLSSCGRARGHKHRPGASPGRVRRGGVSKPT